jgi:hypothetical protein
VYRTKGGPTISSTQATETTTISGHGSHGAPGILPGFLSETIAFRPDSEGEVVATLVTSRAAVRAPLDGAARHLEEGSGAEADERLDRGIRFAFRHFPLVEIHSHALAAASAAEAAALQDRFWDIRELLFHR